MDPSLEYACKRIMALEQLLLVEVPETVWPAEVAMVYSQIESAGELPTHHQRRLQHHINHMWLEKIPVPSIIAAAIFLNAIWEGFTVREEYVCECNERITSPINGLALIKTLKY